MGDPPAIGVLIVLSEQVYICVGAALWSESCLIAMIPVQGYRITKILLSSIYIAGVRKRELKPTSAYICWRQLSRDLWNFFNLNVQRLRHNALCLPFVLLLDLIQLVYPKKGDPGVGNLVIKWVTNVLTTKASAWARAWLLLGKTFADCCYVRLYLCLCLCLCPCLCSEICSFLHDTARILLRGLPWLWIPRRSLLLLREEIYHNWRTHWITTSTHKSYIRELGHQWGHYLTMKYDILAMILVGCFRSSYVIFSVFGQLSSPRKKTISSANTFIGDGLKN